MNATAATALAEIDPATLAQYGAPAVLDPAWGKVLATAGAPRQSAVAGFSSREVTDAVATVLLASDLARGSAFSSLDPATTSVQELQDLAGDTFRLVTTPAYLPVLQDAYGQALATFTRPKKASTAEKTFLRWSPVFMCDQVTSSCVGSANPSVEVLSVRPWTDGDAAGVTVRLGQTYRIRTLLTEAGATTPAVGTFSSLADYQLVHTLDPTSDIPWRLSGIDFLDYGTNLTREVTP